MIRSRIAALLLLMPLLLPTSVSAQPRIADLTRHPGAVPRRLVGYGIVTGLDGTGDRSLGLAGAGTPSVRSVVNLLRRFEIEVPPEHLRMRNVAAVLVTAEISPWMRASGRFDVQIAALGDAISLRGGVLWMTPLVEDVGGDAVGTAQGMLFMPDEGGRGFARRGNSGRIPDGGILEVDPESPPPPPRQLVLRDPDLTTATRIADAINAAFGAGRARVLDPGAVAIESAAGASAPDLQFLSAIDTLRVRADAPPRIVIDAREGTVVAGGDLTIGAAVIQHRGITLQVGGAAADTTAGRGEGLLRVEPSASVRTVAAGLHAAGARPQDLAPIFEALRAAGALRAEVIVR